MDNQTITADELCQLTALTERRHRQLAKDGYFPPPVNGVYQSLPVLQGLFKFYREQQSKRSGGYELERELLTKAKRETAEEQLAIMRREHEPKAEIARKLLAIGEELKSTLQFILIDQLPALNAGLDAVVQRKNNREMFVGICKRFQEWAEAWNH